MNKVECKISLIRVINRIQLLLISLILFASFREVVFNELLGVWEVFLHIIESQK